MATTSISDAGMRPTLAPPAPRRPPIDIATDHCKGCALCIGACPKHILELDTSVVNALGHHPVRLLDPGPCTSCALCARICPDVVFTIYRAEIA